MPQGYIRIGVMDYRFWVRIRFKVRVVGLGLDS